MGAHRVLVPEPRCSISRCFRVARDRFQRYAAATGFYLVLILPDTAMSHDMYLHIYSAKGTREPNSTKKNFYKSQKNIKIEQRRRRKNIQQPYTLHYSDDDVLLLRFFAFSCSCVFSKYLPSIRGWKSPRVGLWAVFVAGAAGIQKRGVRDDDMAVGSVLSFRSMCASLQQTPHGNKSAHGSAPRGIGVM